jgi:signal peptidase I, archaeal type
MKVKKEKKKENLSTDKVEESSISVTTEGDATPEITQNYPQGEIGVLYRECDEYNSSNAVKKRKRTKFWKVFGDIIFGIVLVVLCYGIVVVNLTKQNGNVPFIAGYSLEYIQTGSMEPTLPTGSVILCKEKTDSTIVSVGDIITFKEGYDREGDVPTTRASVTHRVYGISNDDTGLIWYTTKGDNNNAPDQYKILFEDIVATFVRRLT